MKKSIQWRLGIIALSVVVALFLFLPSTPLGASLPDWWRQNVSKITLGLDLRGGSHLVMQVETEKAVEASVDNIIADLQTTAATQAIAVNFTRNEQEVVAKFAPAVEDKVETFVKQTYAILELKDRKAGELRYGLQPAYAQNLKDEAVRQAKDRTERRINKFGVAEPNVYKQGRDQLVIQLPGIKNPQEAISFMNTAGRLEFKLVDTESDLQKALAGKVPEGREILYEEGVDRTGKVSRQPYLLYRQTLLTGDRLKEAKVSIDEYGKPAISITFDGDGARVFERVTGENVGRQLAIVLDGVVHSAPRIKDRIAGGSAQISGNFTHDEAAKLAIVLRESLPAPMKIVQNVTVGPSLGQDSINKGIRAAVHGAAFM